MEVEIPEMKVIEELGKTCHSSARCEVIVGWRSKNVGSDGLYHVTTGRI